MSIPRIINFVWTGGSPMPGWAERNIAEFRRLNPEHEIRIHDERSLRPEYQPAFEACQNVRSRADLLRYSVLEDYGGWYFDADFWPMRPLADAETAWELDGSRLAIARQHGHISGDRLPYANAPLACAPGLPLWPSVRAEIAKRSTRLTLTAYGPELMTWLVANYRQAVTLMDWPWWFPSAIADAPHDYAQALNGNGGWLRSMCPQTGGQLPFAMHLWAAGRPALPVCTVRPRALVMAHEKGLELTEYADPCQRWPDGHALAAAREGLKAAGYDVLCSQKVLGEAPRFAPGGGPIAVAVAWNGRIEPQATGIAKLRAAGIPVYIVEHGFWDRRRWVQCDPAGFLHRASWAQEWGSEPPDVDGRLLEAFPAGIRDMAPRDGDVLVMGQLAGDGQLTDSEIDGPAPLERLVSRALPKGTPARFRPHPLDRPRDAQAIRRTAPLLPRDVDDLFESLSRAKFAVTINSNSIVECLVAGVPVLAFGPSTAINAEVAKRTSAATLPQDLLAMIKGWRPPQDAVRRYLSWLAHRQFRVNDMRTAEFWKARLGNG